MEGEQRLKVILSMTESNSLTCTERSKSIVFRAQISVQGLSPMHQVTWASYFSLNSCFLETCRERVKGLTHHILHVHFTDFLLCDARDLTFTQWGYELECPRPRQVM